MKQKFSQKWIASKQARKQRKYRAQAPLHLKQKMLAAHLSKDLRKKHGIRSIALREGDSIKVMRGHFKAKAGKIASLNLKKGTAYIEGIQRTRKDGTKVSVPLQSSNLLVTALVEDRKRFENLKVKSKSEEKK